MKRKMKNKKGFTLVELLAVIVILGVLLLIAVPSITSVINNSKKNTFVSSAKMVAENVDQLRIMDQYLGSTATCALAITVSDIPLDKGSYGNMSGYVLVENGEVRVYAYDSGLKLSINGETLTAMNAAGFKPDASVAPNPAENIAGTEYASPTANANGKYLIGATEYSKCNF